MWLGLAVFIVESLILVWWIFFRGQDDPPVLQAPSAHAPGERRILVVRTKRSAAVRFSIRSRADGKPRGSRGLPGAEHAGQALDQQGGRGTRRRAGRLDASLAAIRGVGLDASGAVGDDDPPGDRRRGEHLRPGQAIISTHPEGRSNWLEIGVVDHVRERFALR
jgi:hypothetical protein